jgi:peroxiredoxin, Ohr subfamily
VATGPTPEQLFAAATRLLPHGLRLIAAQQDVKVPGSTVTSTVSLLSKEDGGFTLAVKLSVHLPGVEQATADRLVQTTHQVCPYSNATRGNIAVTLEATV